MCKEHLFLHDWLPPSLRQRRAGTNKINAERETTVGRIYMLVKMLWSTRMSLQKGLSGLNNISFIYLLTCGGAGRQNNSKGHGAIEWESIPTGVPSEVCPQEAEASQLCTFCQEQLMNQTGISSRLHSWRHLWVRWVFQQTIAYVLHCCLCDLKTNNDDDVRLQELLADGKGMWKAEWCQRGHEGHSQWEYLARAQPSEEPQQRECRMNLGYLWS